ncbi:MAG: hypothetical protein J0G95_08175 [Rhizobiales bacterium]|nr:hypothetical protein [Hyphomicrobiales bacterium]
MQNIICQHPEQGGAGRDPVARRAVELIAGNRRRLEDDADNKPRNGQ